MLYRVQGYSTASSLSATRMSYSIRHWFRFKVFRFMGFIRDIPEPSLPWARAGFLLAVARSP